MGPKLQEEINKKRLELVNPLDDLERQIENRIRTEYSQAKAINNSLTSFLLSASKIAETRKRYLEMVGITDAKIGEVINATDEAVSNLLVKSRDAKERVNAVKEYLDRLKSLKDKFS